MTALAAERARRFEALKNIDMTLKSGTKAYQGGQCFLELATGKVVPGTATSAGAGYRFLGVFLNTVDATSADKTVRVDLQAEVLIEWFANGTSTDQVQATDVGGVAYTLDDQTVSILGTGKTPAGRIWKVDSVKGVAIERLHGAYPLPVAPQLSLPAFAANDSAPTAVVNGAVYDVPTTAGASTVTLPNAAADGTVIYVCADGTKNGHTVTVRDSSGPTALTAALTASKRLLIVCAKNAGKWTANAAIAP